MLAYRNVPKFRKSVALKHGYNGNWHAKQRIKLNVTVQHARVISPFILLLGDCRRWSLKHIHGGHPIISHAQTPWPNTEQPFLCYFHFERRQGNTRLTANWPTPFVNLVYILNLTSDLLCGPVLRVPSYSSTGPGFDSQRCQIFWEVVGLEQDPLSFVRITEKLLDWKSNGSGSTKSRLTAVGIHSTDHATPSIRKSWH
jgi:hypothetical protein